MPERRSLLRNRDFFLLFSGQVVSVLGSRISSIAFPLLVLALTGSPAKAGIVGFFGALPYLLFQLPAGGLVDRWDRKRTMIVCDVGRALALGSIPVALWLGRPTIPQIAGVAFLEGSLFVFFEIAENAALPRVVTQELLPAAIARNEARSRGAALAGQPLGGLLFGVARALPFLADALSYAFSVLTLLLIRAGFQEERAEPRERLHREIAEGLRWLWTQAFLRATSLLVAGSNFIFAALFLVVVVLARSRGASPALIGVILGFAGGGGFLGAFAASWIRRHVSAKIILIGASWLWAALLPVMALPSRPIVLGLLFGAMAFVGPAWNVVIGAYELTIAPDRLLGRVHSVGMLIAWGVIPLGSLTAGILLQVFGAVRATEILSALMLITAATCIASPTIRHAPQLAPEKSDGNRPDT